jgi:hypothetical protein
MIDPKRRESSLRQIRALMAKTTDNGCTEQEAREAARKVDELMANYEIDMDEVSMRKQEIVEVTLADVGKHTIIGACRAIANFTDCRVWTDKFGANVVYFGFQVDTEIAEYLTHLFRRAIDREAATYILFNREWEEASGKGQSEMFRSFGMGMAGRLGERLRELKSKRDFTARAGGQSLVVMKMPAVNEAFDALGMSMGKPRRSQRAMNASAFAAGEASAASVAINQGVSDRAARNAGRLA